MEILATNLEHAGDASEEDSDIVLTALELTDDLSGILKVTLKKLNKLDTIERAIKKIEGRSSKLWIAKRSLPWDLVLKVPTFRCLGTSRKNWWQEEVILKEELEKIIEYRTKGAILRSKSRWYNEGEKKTKYFLNLEKRHFKQGTISQLKLSDGVLVISDKDILSECESFYKDLYASKIDNSVNFDFFQQANETL